MLDLPRALWESRRIFAEFRPDVVIGVGGYASGPAMLAAILQRIPTLAFEPNVVPGFANRLVARWVSAAAVHFAETGKYFRHCEVTGVPVRNAFFEVAKQSEGFDLTLLIFGGSQGAHAINRVAFDAVPLLLAQMPRLHVIHQTGERDYNDAVAAYDKIKGQVEVQRFIDDMPALFGRADLMVCRSGASTVAEMAAAGKPAIFIPFPRAADDHQKRNAEALARSNAAVMIEEANLSAAILAETITALLNDEARLAQMGNAARKLAHPNAAGDLAKIAARLAGNDLSQTL